MVKKMVVVAAVVMALAAAVGCAAGSPQKASKPPKAAAARPAGKGMAAVQRAAKAKKYLFVFFYKEEDQQTKAMRKVFSAAMTKVAARAQTVSINIAAPSEKQIVDKFEVSRAPMPLVLALAPNGAVTAGFPGKFTQEQLLKAFATPCAEKCIKAVQEGKLVFLCVQNKKTKLNGEAMKGVRDFSADARYSPFSETVTLDPAVKAEGEFLKRLQIDPKTPEAITVCVAPPGGIIGKFKGATTKGMLEAAVKKGCTPGSSCCPKG